MRKPGRPSAPCALWLAQLRCDYHSLAAGQCILELAGASVRDLDAWRLQYDLDHDFMNPLFLAHGALKHAIT